jgi:hypothetical protein
VASPTGQAGGILDDVVDAGVPLRQAANVDERGEHRISRRGEPAGYAS